MDSRARSLGTLAILLALLAAFAWWSTLPGPPRTTTASRDHEAIARAVPDAEIPSAPPPSTDTPPRAPPTRADHVGPLDPCGSDEDDPPITPPSLDDVLQLRVAELNDRMHAALASPHASEALRRGWQAAVDPERGDEALRLLAHAPDRVEDGFDTYVAVSLVLAARALGTGNPAYALRVAEGAARAAPNDPLPLVIGAIAHERREEHAEARTMIARAFALDPEEPAIAYALAWRIEHGSDVAAALTAFDAYLATMPDDRDMARRRARLAIRAATFAGAQTWSRGGLHLVADASFPDDAARHVLEVVDAGLVRGASLLGVPRRDELAIFIHPSRDAMRRATCVQGWAGAVFDGALETDAETVLGGGDRSLTHESFHAAIHPAVPSVPTWLDEGLAQYVSGEEGPAHRRSEELMLREHTWIPFASMNDAFLAIDDSTDAGLAYHQALAMVQWLVERRGERGVRDAAAWLSSGGDPSRVLAEAAHAELDGDTLLDFIRRHLASQAPPRAP